MSRPANQRTLSQAVARVEVQTPDGERRGTAFLVSQKHALTALHVVANRHAEKTVASGPIVLHFPSGQVGARLVLSDRLLDYALLELEKTPAEKLTEGSGPPVSPLILAPITEEDLTEAPATWVSFGFPDARPDGLWISGQIRSTLAQVGGAAAIQLFSDEAAAGQGAALAGLSGAPVFVNGTVAGILRWATLDEDGHSVAGSVFACPVAELLGKLPSVGAALPTLSCPYPGLRSFSAEQSELFFGRRAEIDWLVEHARRQPLLLVIGASGSGKTSLVQAGLVPRLFADWTSLLLRPGKTALPTKDEVTASLSQKKAQRFLLIVDQLEELFLSSSRSAQTDFFEQTKALCALGFVTVVLVLRADVFPELLASAIWPIDPSLRLEVAPLAGDRLVEAIVEPANHQGLHLETGLLERLRAEVADEPGALPLLQETLVLLWERRVGRRMTLPAYVDLARLVEPTEPTEPMVPGQAQHGSGLGAALTLHAEGVWSNLSDEEKRLCRRTLLRLTQFGEGRPHTRRQQPWAELVLGEQERSKTEALLERLLRARLLTTHVGTSRREEGKQPPSVPASERSEVVLVDLAHEAMLRAWPRLRGFLSEFRHAEDVRRRLEQQATEWKRLASLGGGLLDPVETREAEQFLNSPDAQELGTSEAVREWVKQSRAHVDQQARAEQDAAIEKARQSLLLEQERERGRAKWWKTVATMMLLLAVSATALLLWALRERKWANFREEQARYFAEQEARARKLADEKQRLATLRFLVAQAQVRQDSTPDLAMLLGVAAEKLHAGPEAQGLLLSLLQRHAPLSRMIHVGNVPARALAGSLDRNVLAVGFDDGAVWFLDAQTGTRFGKTTLAHQGATSALAFSADGTRLFSGGEDKLVRAFASAPSDRAGESIGMPLVGHGAWVKALAASPDGRYLASGSDDGTILLWDQQTGELAGPPLRELQKAVAALAYSPDSRFLLSGSDDQTVRVWDAKTAKRIHVLQGAQKRVQAVSFVGKLAAAGDWDGNVLFWDAQTGKQLGKPLHGHSFAVTGLGSTADGALLSVSWDGSVIKWHTTEGRDATVVMSPRRGALQTVSLSAKDSSLWTYTNEGKLLEVDLSERSPFLRDQKQYSTELSCLAVSRDGTRLAVGGWGQAIEVWKTEGQRLLLDRVLSGHSGSVSAVAFSPNGKTLASAGFDKTVRLWTLETGEGKTVESGDEITHALAFSPDGKWLGAGGFDFAVRLYDLSALGGTPKRLLGHHGAIWGMDFSPDGKVLCTASQDQTVRVWNMSLFEGQKELVGHSRAVTACRFSDEGHVLSSSEDQTLRYWEWASGKTLGEPMQGHSARITSIAIHKDRARAFSVSEDKTLRLWDLNRLQAVGTGLVGHHKSISSVATSPDGNTAYSVSHDGTLRVWDLQEKSLVAQACRLAGRDMTREERDRFLEDVSLPPLCAIR